MVKDMTYVSIPQPSKYTFQYSEITMAEEDLLSVLEILNNTNKRDIVDVCGKIANITELI